METKIKCEICGQEMKRITRTHLSKHNMSTDNYKALYPNSPLLAEASAYLLGYASRNMSDERKAQVGAQAKALFTGKPKSLEQRKKLSKSKTGVSWGRHTEESKARMRVSQAKVMRERMNKGWVSPNSSPEGRMHMSKQIREIRATKHWSSRGGTPNKGKKLNLSPEQRANRSQKRVAYLSQNETVRFGTSLERKMEAFLSESSINYDAQFAIHTNKGSWLFDFYIAEKKLLVEVDGEYFHSLSAKIVNRDRIKEELARSLGYAFIRISDNDWQPELIFASHEEQVAHSAKLLLKRTNKFTQTAS